MQKIGVAIQTNNCFKVKQYSIFLFVENKNALIKFFIGDYGTMGNCGLSFPCYKRWECMSNKW